MKFLKNYGLAIVLLMTAVLGQAASAAASKNRDIETDSLPPQPSLLISDINFTQHGEQLQTKSADFLEVFVKNTENPIKITVKGDIFGLTQAKILSILLPEQQQLITDSNGTEFEISMDSTSELRREPTHLLIGTSETSSKSQFQTIDFVLRPAREYPSQMALITESAKSQGLNLSIIALSSMLALFILFTALEGGLLRIMMAVVVSALFFGGSVFLIGQKSVPKLLEYGYFSKSLAETLLVKQQKTKPEKITLTSINAEGTVSASLARSWSQLDPLTWQIDLSDSLPSGITVEDIRQKLLGGIPTVKEGVLKDNHTLELTTKAPDPLIPQKLSTLDLTPPVMTGSSDLEAYVPLTDGPGEVRSRRNEQYRELPFVEKSPIFSSVRYEENLDALKKIIKEKSAGEFDEPDPSLWPLLAMNQYRILPKMNTGIVVLMVNRASPLLKDKAVIEVLRGLLRENRLLETSYFQFGRIGTQFAPPGVIGYDPDLKIPKDEGNFKIPKNAKLTLEYPMQEKPLASVVEKLLEQGGIDIAPEEIKTEELEKTLSNGFPDLLLLPLRFELGDIGPFLDNFIFSGSPFNHSYRNEDVDRLILKSRTELNGFERLKTLHEIMKIITVDDPAGIPILFKRSFVAVKKDRPALPWYLKIFQY